MHDPRAEYHNKPDAEFVTLCDEADRMGLRILLNAHQESLTSLVIHEPIGNGAAIVPLEPGDTWRTLAERARTVLETMQ